jgi:hypothetical protein
VLPPGHVHVLVFGSADHVGDVMLANAVDRWSEPQSGQTKNYKIGSVASPLSTQHYGERAKIGWLGSSIMCPNEVTFLPAD